jgi:hypothetical protein
VRTIDKEEILKVRYPKATRPWQHVLEPLSGYLYLGQKLFEIKRNLRKLGTLDQMAAVILLLR